jgi:carbonic anhydrase/acetyltransferase-like protein (isoleucine patch superfamily)
MPLIKSVKGKSPDIHPSVWLAENATVVGDVTISKGCSIWFSAVIRGDVNRIILGENVNVQDGVVIHCTYKKTKTKIGDNVSIGHNAIIHGCQIANNVLVGMGAIVMDNAQIKKNVIIAAGAVVLQNSVLEPNAVYAGIPAKKVKDLSPELFQHEIERIASNYKMYSSWFEEG